MYIFPLYMNIVFFYQENYYYAQQVCATGDDTQCVYIYIIYIYIYIDILYIYYIYIIYIIYILYDNKVHTCV